MRYATYRRVSTGRQADEGLSLDAQAARLREYADGRGWAFVADYCDPGVSGKRDDRPEFQRALADAEAGQFDVLLVAALDRFGRGTRAALANFERLERAGVKLVSLREQVDTTTPGGQFVRTLFAAFAEMESALIGERTRAGLDEARAKGRWTGGPVPTGYVIADGKLAPDPEWAPVIRRLFDLALEGHAPGQVSRLMNQGGYRTRRGRPWTRRAIQNVLSNPAYIGAIVHHRGEDNEARVEGAHPALITPAEQERILATWMERDSVARGRPTSGRPTTRYAASRLARCGRCGERMYALTSPYRRKDGSHARRYACANTRASNGLCTAPPVDAELVDASLVRDLPRLLNVRHFAERLAASRDARRLPLEASLDAAVGEVRRLDGAIAALERKLADAAGGAGFDALLGALERARADRERTEQRAQAAGQLLRELADTPEPGDAVVALADRLTAAVRHGGNMEDLNNKLRATFEAIELDTAEDGTLLIRPVVGEWALTDLRLPDLPNAVLDGLNDETDELLESLAAYRAELEAELRRRGDDDLGTPAVPEDPPPADKGPQGQA